MERPVSHLQSGWEISDLKNESCARLQVFETFQKGLQHNCCFVVLPSPGLLYCSFLACVCHLPDLSSLRQEHGCLVFSAVPALPQSRALRSVRVLREGGLRTEGEVVRGSFLEVVMYKRGLVG